MSISHEMREAAERAGAARAEVTVTRVRAGEVYTAETHGGYIRKRAAVNGVLIGDGERTFFVDVATMRKACR